MGCRVSAHSFGTRGVLAPGFVGSLSLASLGGFGVLRNSVLGINRIDVESAPMVEPAYATGPGASTGIPGTAACKQQYVISGTSL